jgi:hypothetical protein
MPRPIYTICAQFSLENKDNALISLIDIIEKIQAMPLTLPVPPAGQVAAIVWQPFRVISCWMREPSDDVKAEYEFQLAFYLPPNDQEQILGTGPVSFTETKPLFRGTALIVAPPQIQGPGILRVVSRFRKKGAATWLSHEYPVIIEMIQSQPANPSGNPA